MNAHRPTSVLPAFHEQIRAVGLALRRETLLLAALAAGFTALAVFHALQSNEPLNYTPRVALLAAGLGLLLPFAVWKGENLFGGAHLWTLPVDRRRHALIKAAAGWVWLMPAIAAVVLLLILMVLLTGGRLIGDATRQVLVDEHLQTLRWSDPAWFWMMPFTAATLGYLAGSAVVLGLKRRLWWIAAAVLALFFLAVTGEIDGVVQTLLMRQLGLDYALTGASDAFHTQRVLPNGEAVLAWGGVPSLARWAAATACWTAAGVVAVWLAASRHRES